LSSVVKRARQSIQYCLSEEAVEELAKLVRVHQTELSEETRKEFEQLYVRTTGYMIDWQKQQAVWEIFEYQVEEGGMSPFTVDGSIPVLTYTDMILLPKDKFKVGDKVKLIITKED
jgi:predicted solute-binding protein